MKSKPTTADMMRLSVSLLVAVMSLVLLCTSSTAAAATEHSLSDPISNQVGQSSVIPSAASYVMENSVTPRSGSGSGSGPGPGSRSRSHRVVRTIDIIKNALQHRLNFNSNQPSSRKYIAPYHRYGAQYNYYNTDRQDSGSKQRGHGNRQKGIYFRG